MKVYADGRPFSSNGQAGVSRYCFEVVESLVAAGHTVVLVSNRKIERGRFFKFGGDVEFLEYGGFYSYVPGSLFVMLVLPCLFLLKRRQVFWGGNHAIPLWRFRSVVSIHDVVSFRHGDTMTTSNRILVSISILLSMYFSDVVATVSKFTRDELVELFASWMYRGKPIHIIANKLGCQFRPVAPQPSLEWLSSHSSTKNQDLKLLESGYLLALGTLEPRKNLGAVIDIFEEVVKSGYQGCLVLAGGGGWKNEALVQQLATSSCKEKILLPGFVPDELLPSLYSGCDVFLFPSIYEGFGLPPLEAYACGARVVCSLYGELPNIVDGGDSILYVDPFDPLVVSKACAFLLKDGFTAREKYNGGGEHQFLLDLITDWSHAQ